MYDECVNKCEYEEQYGVYITSHYMLKNGIKHWITFNERVADYCNPTHWKYLPDTPDVERKRIKEQEYLRQLSN